MQDINNIEESSEVEEAIPENEGTVNKDTSENEGPVAGGSSENEPTVNEVTSVIDAAPEKESKWYVLRVVSGKERKVKEYLDKDIIRNGWDKIIKQIFLPVEKVYKVQNGKKVMRERNFYPGYVMIEVENGKLSDEMVQHLSNISNVMHFLTDGKGSKGMIISLRKAEVNKMLGKVDEMADASGIKMSEPFIIGETIKIIDGPFNDFNGVIEEVNDEKKKTKSSGKNIWKSNSCRTQLYAGRKISIINFDT